MVLGSSCGVVLGVSLLLRSLRCAACLPVAAVDAAPQSSGAVCHGLSPDPAPRRGLRRLTTTCCGWPLPETRDAVSLQHCSYALVNQLAAVIPAGHGPFAIVCAAEAARTGLHGAEEPRTVSLGDLMAGVVVAIDAGYDRGARPRRRRAGPGGRRRLPGADPALPPPGLGGARPRRNLGRRSAPRWPSSAAAWPSGATTVAAIGITNQRETLVAFDRSTGRPLAPAIVWQDRRTAALCAELADGGPPPAGAGHDGPRARSVLQRHEGGLAPPPRRPRPGADDPDLCLLHGGHAGCCGTSPAGTDGGVYATDPSNASRTLLLDTATLAWSAELCALFGVPAADAARGAAVGGPIRHRRAGDLGPAAAVLDGVPVAGVLGDQQAALFGQSCFDPGMVKVTYGTGSFALANAGPDRPAGARRPHRQLRLGPRGRSADRRRPRRLRARGLGLRLGRRHPVAARRARHHLVGGGGRSVGAVGPRQRRGHLRARPSPASGARGGTPPPAASSPGSRVASAAPSSPAPAWRPWRSRCAT